LYNPSDRIMVLGSNQPLTEMSTRNISWGLRRPVPNTDNLPPSCAVVTKSGNLNFLEPSGPLRTCNGTALPFIILYRHLQLCTWNKPCFNGKTYCNYSVVTIYGTLTLLNVLYFCISIFTIKYRGPNIAVFNSWITCFPLHYSGTSEWFWYASSCPTYYLNYWHYYYYY